MNKVFCTTVCTILYCIKNFENNILYAFNGIIKSEKGKTWNDTNQTYNSGYAGEGDKEDCDYGW